MGRRQKLARPPLFTGWEQIRAVFRVRMSRRWQNEVVLWRIPGILATQTVQAVPRFDLGLAVSSPIRRDGETDRRAICSSSNGFSRLLIRGVAYIGTFSFRRSSLFFWLSGDCQPALQRTWEVFNTVGLG